MRLGLRPLDPAHGNNVLSAIQQQLHSLNVQRTDIQCRPSLAHGNEVTIHVAEEQRALVMEALTATFRVTQLDHA